jgi:hypothetical protein
MSYTMSTYTAIHNLLIQIPSQPTDADYGYWLLRLKYLETAACKASMTEVARRAEIKEATEKFRAAIRIRDSGGFDPLYA